MELQHKSRHVKALLALSKISGLYPESLILKGIEMAPHPIVRGGFGDVYKGELDGQKVAVKMLKIYQTSDMSKYHKVALQLPHTH
jgi:hypothetical protein